MRNFFVLVFFMLTYSLSAQTIEFSMDNDCRTRVDEYNAALQTETQIKVYRIQYAVLADRMAMETEMKKFSRLFSLFTDWYQKGPYYYLKAGAYLSRLDAFSDMLAISKYYPGAIYVVDSVKKRKLL